MSVRYWVGVVSGVHVDFATREGVCAFSKGNKAGLLKFSDGDWFVYYSPKTGFMEDEPIQCFTALGTIIDPTPVEINWMGMISGWQKQLSPKFSKRLFVRCWNL